MTDNQRDVLLALNLRQMQRADFSNEDGVWTAEVAQVAGRSVRSTAVILSQVRDFAWVSSVHNFEARVGWFLTATGVTALERDAGRRLRVGARSAEAS